MKKELQEVLNPKLEEGHLGVAVNALTGETTVVIDDGLSWDFLFNLPQTLLEHFIKLKEQSERPTRQNMDETPQGNHSEIR